MIVSVYIHPINRTSNAALGLHRRTRKKRISNFTTHKNCQRKKPGDASFKLESSNARALPTSSSIIYSFLWNPSRSEGHVVVRRLRRGVELLVSKRGSPVRGWCGGGTTFEVRGGGGGDGVALATWLIRARWRRRSHFLSGNRVSRCAWNLEMEGILIKIQLF